MGVKRIGSMIDILISSPHNKTQLIGNFSNDEGDDNVKKSCLDLLRKTTTLHVHHVFLYIFLPSLHDYDVKIPNFTF